MTYDYHALVSVLSLVFGAIGYTLYFRSIFAGVTKPHIFTWVTYAIIDSIVFVAQVLKGAGPGAWALAFSVCACVLVSIIALKKGEKQITVGDWACFLGAFVAIGFWLLTSNPLVAVVIAALINVLALVPTFRKSYLRPQEESLSTWIADIFKYGLSLFALVSFNLTTALFPAAIVACNSVLVAMILIRRRQLAARNLMG